MDTNTIASLPEVNRTDAASVATAFIKYGILGNLYDLQYDLSVYGTPDNWFTFYKIDSGYEENEPMDFGGNIFNSSDEYFAWRTMIRGGIKENGTLCQDGTKLVISVVSDEEVTRERVTDFLTVYAETCPGAKHWLDTVDFDSIQAYREVDIQRSLTYPGESTSEDGIMVFLIQTKDGEWKVVLDYVV